MTRILALFGFGCFCLLAVGLNWRAEQAEREADVKARYDRCLPEPGQKTVAWWENGKMQCQIEQVGYARPSRVVARVMVD